MEQCMVRPEVKKKKPTQPRPTSAPPKPPKPSSEVGGSSAKTEGKERTVGTPEAPLKPSDVANMNRIQRERTAQTPVVPPRPTEKELSNTVSFRRYQTAKTQDNQNENTGKTSSQPTITPRHIKQVAKENDPEVSEAVNNEIDFRRGKVAMLTEMFQKGPTEPASTFVSYISDSEPPKPEEMPEDEKPTPENKKGGFKGMLNKANPFKSQASVDKGLSAEEPDLEKDQSGDEVEEKRPSEGKQGKGGFMAGMFKGLQKEKTSAPDLKVSPATSDAENMEEEEAEETKEKGLFHGIFKKTPKSDPAEGALSKDLSASNDSLSDGTKEKGSIFSGIFKKPKNSQEGTIAQDNLSVHSDLSVSDDDGLAENSNNAKGKGGMLSGMFKKAPKSKQTTKPTDDEGSIEDLSAHKELSASNDNLSEEKGGLFSGIFKKASKATEEDKELSASNENLTEPTKKEGVLSGMFKKKPPKTAEVPPADEDKKSINDDLSGSMACLIEKNTKEKGNVLGGWFKKTQRNPDDEEDKKSLHDELSASEENLADKPKEKGNVLGGWFKKAQRNPEDEEDKKSLHDELSASEENLADKPKEKGGVFGIFKRSKTLEDSDEDPTESTASTEDLSDNTKTKEKQSVFSGMFKKPKPKESQDEDKDSLSTDLSGSTDDLSENSKPKEKSAGLSGMFRRSPKPALRSQASTDPLTEFSELSDSNDSLADMGGSQEFLSVDPQLSGSTDALVGNNKAKEKKGMLGIFRRSPRPAEQDAPEGEKDSEGKSLMRRGGNLKKKRVVSFRVKRTLPRMPKFSLNPSAQNAAEEPLLEEPMELKEKPEVQETTAEQVEIEEVEMAAYPTEGNPLEAEGENDGLMDWWRTVEGWDEWNEATQFEEDQEEEAVEAVADRVFMAARLFVHLFNQRGASLQQRILEMLALADAVDEFHKKAISAAVGGGVASVAGSVATITGLVLAPFTFGASIIVTAVGISVATAGSITSATANITDTVHAKMDRKKVEKMIQGYQEEIKDIRECMEFVQEGMLTLEDWNFQKYSETMAQNHMTQNIKHVMKEGGRAGKALMINTDQLISTVQVLGVAGGAAKAAQAISVTTGVMSALFLALDVFFLAKDSHELRKGAKTKFASKIREVCKELQGGLLELNKVKSQLQKTMDGIEVEAYVEEGEEEEEEDEDDEDDLESDPDKLAQLEKELDQLEEKLDKKMPVEPSKKDVIGKDSNIEKGREHETKSEKEKKNKSEKMDGMMEMKVIEEDQKSVNSHGGGLGKQGKENEGTQEENEMEKGEYELTGAKDTDNGVSNKNHKKDFDRESRKGDEDRNKVVVNVFRAQEDETKKGKPRLEKRTCDGKSQMERPSTRINDPHNEVKEDEERWSRRGSRTDVDLKEPGQTQPKPKQERGGGRGGGVQKEERDGTQKESTKKHDGERELRDESFSKQEGRTNRGHRSELGDGRSESFLPREEEDGRRKQKEGERRGSRLDQGGEKGRVEARRGSREDHASLRGSSGKEWDADRKGSRQEHGSERRGGEERRGSRQEYSSEKRRSGTERDVSRRESEKEPRERRKEGNGDKPEPRERRGGTRDKPEPSSRARSIQQDGLSI